MNSPTQRARGRPDAALEHARRHAALAYGGALGLSAGDARTLPARLAGRVPEERRGFRAGLAGCARTAGAGHGCQTGAARDRRSDAPATDRGLRQSATATAAVTKTTAGAALGRCFAGDAVPTSGRRSDAVRGHASDPTDRGCPDSPDGHPADA